MDHEDDQPEEKVLKRDYAIALWKQGREKWNTWVYTHPEAKVLKGDDAIELWKQGREKWNTWVEDHQDWCVEILMEDFSKYRRSGSDISFSKFKFPNGYVYFSGAQFGDGDVDFSGAQFGKGTVSFNGVQFGKGYVNFSDVVFGKGYVTFSDVVFGKGYVNFSNAKFGEGDVNFSNAQCGKGTVSFSNAQFGEGSVNFSNAQFGEGRVRFIGTQFGEGSVNFNNAQFGEGRVSFANAQFGDGNVVFSHAKFGEGDVDFSHAKFSKGDFTLFAADLVNVKRLSFRSAKWGGHVKFHPKIGAKMKVIDFSSAVIDGELSFGAFITSCVIDLRHTKLNHPIDLDRVDINYRSRIFPKRFFLMRFPIAYNQDASTCFRRLKKLAKDADDHERALDFYAKEMRSSYGRELRGWPLFLYLLYDKISDYGRSLLIPTTLLCAMIVMYGLVYFQISSWQNIGSFAGLGSMDRAVNVVNHFGSALTFSLAHALPFYFGSREANSDTMDTLFSTNPPDYLHWLTISQGMVCGVLLFLIALALRNRFRS